MLQFRWSLRCCLIIPGYSRSITMSKNDPNMRLVSDSFGPIEIPADSYYGPQTARSMKHFNINRSHDRMPLPIIHSLAMLKEVAADINCKYARISASHAEAIKKACQEVYSGQLDKEFPLSIWQTGSGTQSNMNVNEVIANRANEILNGNRTDKPQIHPNDHVNCGQSSNDIFPTAMNVSVALETAWKVIPALKTLHSALTEKTEAFSSIVKIGRTHLQDAVPMTVGQELGAFTTQLRQSIDCIKHSLLSVCELAVGGTAVGTGLNSTKGFDKQVCLELNNLVKKLFLDLPTAASKHAVDLEFVPAENKFAALAGHDTLLQLSSAFNRTATVLFKLADDFILLSSGPGCGFGELLLPPNEPGSSIMPAQSAFRRKLSDFKKTG
ncbi:unnamed protein product [Dicrocoelium dendriticum]|nr:unnamed protein product [Dicrocoelium dendriticum]